MARQKLESPIAKIWLRIERIGTTFGLSPRLLRFMVVGGSGVLVNLGVLYITLVLLPHQPWRPHVASWTGIAVSILTNFLLNDAWTWGDRIKVGRRHWFVRLAKFYLVSSVAAMVQYGVFFILFEKVGFQGLLGEKVGSLVAQCVGILLAMVINYLINNYWTFREIRAQSDSSVGSESPPPGHHDEHRIESPARLH